MTKKKNEEILGLAHGNIRATKKLNDEKMFSTPRGHGYAAEHASDLVDKFKEVDFFGQQKVRLESETIDPNTGHIIKNGADRVVNGVQIQTKYCKSGSKCISECFENGRMKYTIDGNTKPMQIEVPSDKYEEAVAAMEVRIRKGEVPGVKDPAEARNIVRKGYFTYAQAKNIAKAGTVESLVYDSVNGVIIAAPAFGLTALLTFANSIWEGDTKEVALKKSVCAGLNVAGSTFAITVISSQISKSFLKGSVDAVSNKVVGIIGNKAARVIATSMNGGKSVTSAAAKKLLSQSVGKDIITGTVTVVVLSAKDISDIFRGRISRAQFYKNVTNVAAGVAGGFAGKVGGAVAGAAIGTAIAPGVGTAIGGKVGAVVGTVAGGLVAGKTVGSINDQFIENDSERLLRIAEIAFSNLCRDYLVNTEEARAVADEMNEVFDEKELKEMYRSDNQMEYAYSVIEPIFETVVSRRKHILIPSDKDMVGSLKNVLEEIADDETHIVSETAKITCSNCGKVFNSRNKFCTGCSKPIEQVSAIKCKACGAEFKKKIIYCKKCGEKI